MAAPGGTGGGTQGDTGRYSVPEVARLLGISERAVRKRITAGTLPAERDGAGHWVVTLEAVPEAVPGAVPGGPWGGTAAVPGPEPIEGRYRVTPTEIEQAIERTGAKYVADLQVLFDQVGALYAARLADKDQTIAAQAETIAELRRRAEVAEQALATIAANGLTQDVTAAEPPPAATSAQVRRPWWAFWRWGAAHAD